MPLRRTWPIAIRCRAALQDASSRFGAIDILVNNAGQARSAPMHKMEDALWHTMLAVNLTGTYYGMRHVLPSMLQRDFGRIVNIASTAGLKGYPYVSAYSAAKHGVVGLTRSRGVGSGGAKHHRQRGVSRLHRHRYRSRDHQ